MYAVNSDFLLCGYQSEPRVDNTVHPRLSEPRLSKPSLVYPIKLTKACKF